MPTTTPCLWFDSEGEDAAKFYVSVFPNSRIVETSYYGEGAPKPAGSVLTVSFELDGKPFLALNGGPEFTFSEAISFMVSCEGQAEVDHYWNALSEGGSDQQCGWLKDKYGVSWQIVPTVLPQLIGGPDREGAQRALSKMMSMQKLVIADLEDAYNGVG